MSTLAQSKRGQITAEITQDLLIFRFADGESLRLDAALLSDEIKLAALMHGLKQKIGDAAAIKCDPLTGKPADLATKRKNMADIINRLQSGQWSIIGQGGGRTYGVLLEALHRMNQGRKTYEELGEFLKAKTKEQKAALEVDKRIAPFIMGLRQKGQKKLMLKIYWQIWKIN